MILFDDCVSSMMVNDYGFLLFFLMALHGCIDRIVFVALIRFPKMIENLYFSHESLVQESPLSDFPLLNDDPPTTGSAFMILFDDCGPR